MGGLCVIVAGWVAYFESQHAAHHAAHPPAEEPRSWKKVSAPIRVDPRTYWLSSPPSAPCHSLIGLLMYLISDSLQALPVEVLRLRPFRPQLRVHDCLQGQVKALGHKGRARGSLSAQAAARSQSEQTPNFLPTRQNPLAKRTRKNFEARQPDNGRGWCFAH